MPVEPCSMNSPGPPESTATTVTPRAIPSSRTIPNGSGSEALTRMSIWVMYGPASGTWPVIVTSSARPSSRTSTGSEEAYSGESS